jgi:Na+/melibiose symporter-like transporter
MARWSFWGAVGDLAVPPALWLLSFAGAGWRHGLALAALASAALALVHASSRALDRRGLAGDQEEERVPIRVALREALANRRLLGWIVAETTTNLLDETLVAFAAIHMAQAMGAEPGERSLALGALIAGDLVGLAWLERALAKHDALKILAITAALVVPALGAFTFAPNVGIAAVALFALGVVGATLHPISAAQTYASMPGRPEIVNAVGAGIAIPLDLLLVGGMVVLADAVGSWAAMIGLLVAPIVVGAAALVLRRR